MQKILEYDKTFRDKRKKRMVKYYKNNKNKVRQRVINFLNNNPEKSREYNKNRRHKKHTITNEQWLSCKEYFNNCCAYCGLEANKHFIKRKGKLILIDLHKEHYIYNGSNDLSNCIPSCQTCNSEKWEYNPEDWYNENNPKYSLERINKINMWLNSDYKKFI